MLHWLNLRKQDVNCYFLHSYNDADIDFTKLSGQCSLKCLITNISENGIYLCYYCIVQTIIQNHCIFQNKTSVGPNIYAKLLFLYALSGCDTTSLINGVAEATVFKKLLSNKQLAEAASVFTSLSQIARRDRINWKKAKPIIL